MVGVFLDANVLIAGAGSPTGGSRQILDWAERKLIQVYVSRRVLDEARRNVSEKLPRALPPFERIIKAIKPRIVREPSKKAIQQAAQVIDAKDAPILAAAISINVDYLVTLDRKHFHTSAAKNYTPFPILLPADFVLLLRPTLEHK